MRCVALRSCRRLAAVALAAAAPGQQDAAFAAAYERMLAAPAEARVAAAVAASDAFLALADPAQRAAQRVAGLHAATLAERWPLAIALANEVRQAGAAGELLVRCELQALLRGASFAAFVDRAIADVPHARRVVHEVLLADEPRVMQLAEKALRSGDRTRGRFVFAEVAASEPVASYRLANFALCLRQLGEIDAARAVYERARELAPDDLDLGNDYGLFLRATGDRAGAVREFARAWALDLRRPEPQRARGPAITNLLHLEAIERGAADGDPLPDAQRALAVRPDAAMLTRLVLDVALDRLDGATPKR